MCSSDLLINPLLEPIRSVLPSFGMFDFSPIVLMVILEFFERVKSFPYEGKDLTRSKLRRVFHWPAPWLMLSGLWSLVTEKKTAVFHGSLFWCLLAVDYIPPSRQARTPFWA